ncbi:hypothetical protein RNS17_13205, partial [Staphylococcus pseudintermedius]|uniref:hypothetical protein n=1 Tax=Staphylococcus pseudintermedius TaxID=283734 RepID=UPI002887C19C
IMLCRNCNLNESTIHLYTSVNGKQRQVDLCQNCYQIMKSNPANSILNGQPQDIEHKIDPQVLSLMTFLVI